MEAQKNIVTVEGFYGKHFINEAYRPIAEALVKKYDELKHIVVKNILFIEDTESKKKKNGTITFAQIGLIPDKWDEIIYQMTGRHFYYMLEVFKMNTIDMSREQIIALIYHELRHIGTDGEMVSHDIEEWANMVAKLGVNWNSTKTSIPDLLDNDVDWESITGPATLFPGEITLRLVK